MHLFLGKLDVFQVTKVEFDAFFVFQGKELTKEKTLESGKKLLLTVEMLDRHTFDRPPTLPLHLKQKPKVSELGHQSYPEHCLLKDSAIDQMVDY